MKYQTRRRTYKRARKARRPQSRKQSTFSVKKLNADIMRLLS